MEYGFCSMSGGFFRLQDYELQLIWLARKSGPARPRTQSSFQLLSVPLSLPMKLPV
jgi:hypothetical protein